MKETIERIASKRDQVRKTIFAILIVMIISLGLVLFGQQQFGMILGTLTMVFFFIWKRRKNREYSDMVGEANILNGLATPLKDPKYLGSAGLTVKDLDEMAMLPIRMDDHGLLIRQGFEGQKARGTCRGWETTFHYQRSEKKTDCAFLSGTLLTKSFDQPLSNGLDWVTVRRELLAGGVPERFFQEKGYKVIPTGNEKLDQTFLTGTRSNCVLPGNLIARIAGITGRLEQIGAIRCTPNAAAVFLDHRFYTYPIKARDLPTEDQLKVNPLPERDDIWELFEYFQKEEKKE